MPALLLLLALAQSGAPAAPEGEHLDRIRTAIAVQPAITVPAEPDNSGRPVFRVRVEAWTFTYKAWEEPAKGVPSYVRPSMPLAHYEYLQMVTPEAFRASTLYPGMIGVGFDPGQLKDLFTKWHRAAQERSAREEVRRDVDAYLRARGEVR
jgi:hypothetical protein